MVEKKKPKKKNTEPVNMYGLAPNAIVRTKPKPKPKRDKEKEKRIVTDKAARVASVEAFIDSIGFDTPRFPNPHPEAGITILTKKPKHPGGRPSLYSKELVDRICLKVATTSLGLDKLSAENDWFPNPDTIYEWRKKYPEFSDLYAQAKLHQAEILAEEIIQLSDNCAEEYHRGSEYIMAARLQVDSRKWTASKLLPKLYGDRTQTDSNVTIVSHEDAIKALK